MDDNSFGSECCSLCGDCDWEPGTLCRYEHADLVARGVLTEDDFIEYNRLKPEAIGKLTDARNLRLR